VAGRSLASTQKGTFASCEAPFRALASCTPGRRGDNQTTAPRPFTSLSQTTLASGSMRGVLGCIVLIVCGAQRALAQTLQCPLVGFARYPVLPASHSCAGVFGTANGLGTADGQGLCAILNLGLGEACGGEAGVPTEDSWWAAHLVCTPQTANCKTTAEIAGGPSSRRAHPSAPATSDSCYTVCVWEYNATAGCG
jgi:hypothetical protein